MIHLQVPDDEQWENPKDHVGGGSEDSIRDRRILHQWSGEATSFFFRKLQPKIADGVELNGGEDEVDEGQDGG